MNYRSFGLWATRHRESEDERLGQESAIIFGFCGGGGGGGKDPYRKYFGPHSHMISFTSTQL